jgi:molecular chaperone GrpE
VPKAKPDQPSAEENLQHRVAELTQALQMERADAINLRRRHEVEINSLKTNLKASIIRELLPVIDNFERALQHVPKDLAGSDYIKGVEAVVKQFGITLGQIGVERIKTLNQPFDPLYHEAVSLDEGEGSKEVVTEELLPGYKIGDKVLRHAMVRVKRTKA